MMRRHYQLLKEDKGEITASLEIRTFILYYLKGIKGSKEIKNKICQTKSSEEIFEILDKFEQKLKEAE
jgi:tRNA-dihydrouridine synthase